MYLSDIHCKTVEDMTSQSSFSKNVLERLFTLTREDASMKTNEMLYTEQQTVAEEEQKRKEADILYMQQQRALRQQQAAIVQPQVGQQGIYQRQPLTQPPLFPQQPAPRRAVQAQNVFPTTPVVQTVQQAFSPFPVDVQRPASPPSPMAISPTKPPVAYPTIPDMSTMSPGPVRRLAVPPKIYDAKQLQQLQHQQLLGLPTPDEVPMLLPGPPPGVLPPTAQIATTPQTPLFKKQQFLTDKLQTMVPKTPTQSTQFLQVPH
jgi:hypothetical protein